MPPLGRYSRAAATAISQTRMRSATDIEKNSPCLPQIKSPATLKSTNQWCKFFRRPASSIANEDVNGVGTAAQMPWRRSRA